MFTGPTVNFKTIAGWILNAQGSTNVGIPFKKKYIGLIGATPWSSGNTIASRERGPGSNPGCGEMLSTREDWESMRVVDDTNSNIDT